MITQKNLVEMLLMIYNRDNRIKDTINIYERFVDIIKTPYSGDSQYPAFIKFLKEFNEGVDGEAIVNTFYKNPGFINIIRNISRSTEEAALLIANLNHIITSQSIDIKSDLRYLTLYRKLYSNCVLLTIDGGNATTEEATSYAAFILSAFECNPYMSPEIYISLVNALYDALFEFLFMGGEYGAYTVPSHPFLNPSTKSNYVKKTFRFDEFINHIPIVTKVQFSSCSVELKNIKEKSLAALEYISDFYWMIEKCDKGYFEDIKNLFDNSEPI